MFNPDATREPQGEPIEEGLKELGIEEQVENQQERIDAFAAELGINLYEFEQLADKEPQRGWSLKVKRGIKGVRDFITDKETRFLNPLMGVVAGGVVVRGIAQGKDIKELAVDAGLAAAFPAIIKLGLFLQNKKSRRLIPQE